MNTIVNPESEVHKGAVSEVKNKPITDPESRPANGYTIELLTGAAITDLLFSDPGFQKSWDALFESCTWATVFQSRQFVAAWYHVYSDQHRPILIRAVERGQLKGVLPMVLLDGRKGGRITGAGHYDAEYQTWLAAPSDGDAFIKKALAELMKQFPGHPVTFRFLPPKTPLDWIRDDKKWRQCTIVQSYTRPLINLNPGNAEDAKLLRGTSHFRNKLNRLKRFGEVQFECIRDLESFESSLNEIAVMYDFRQSAMFNKNHFKDDPLKKHFLCELFRLQLLHTTVLKVDGKIMAAVVAIAGKDDWVHLAGINCHSPYKARFLSPGYLHFVLMLKQLVKEQKKYFDLTPGYDSYKEELANCHDEVKELVISPSQKFHIKKQIRKWVHGHLIARGIRPMTVELTLKKYQYQVRHFSAVFAIKRLLQKKRKKKIYSILTNTLRSACKISLQKNSLSDLLQFKFVKTTGLTRWDFLADAMQRFEKGQHCFTLIENGLLLCCAWISYPDTPAETNSPPIENAIVLQSFYCHAAAKDRLQSFVNGVIDAVVDKEKSSNYFFSDDPLFCTALESAGFPVMSE